MRVAAERGRRYVGTRRRPAAPGAFLCAAQNIKTGAVGVSSASIAWACFELAVCVGPVLTREAARELSKEVDQRIGSDRISGNQAVVALPESRHGALAASLERT